MDGEWTTCLCNSKDGFCTSIRVAKSPSNSETKAPRHVEMIMSDRSKDSAVLLRPMCQNGIAGPAVKSHSGVTATASHSVSVSRLTPA